MKIELDIADECIDQIFVKEAMNVLGGCCCYGDDKEAEREHRQWAEWTLKYYGRVDEESP